MTNSFSTFSQLKLARFAGILYLVIIVCGISAEVGVRAQLIDWNSAAETAKAILASPGLFKMGFLADVLMILSDIGIAIIFYVLFKSQSPTLSLTASVFRFAQAAVLAFNMLNYFAASLILTTPAIAANFGSGAGDSTALLFLNLHSHGYDLGLIFFAISNIFLGYLIVKSDRFPSFLGYGLLAAAFVYLLGSFTRFLFPAYLPAIEPLYAITLLAELVFCLWLLIKGIRNV